MGGFSIDADPKVVKQQLERMSQLAKKANDQSSVKKDNSGRVTSASADDLAEMLSNLRPAAPKPAASDADQPMKRGGQVKKMASGGKVSSASRRADGIAQRGKTKGRYL